jgi:hypothetical protein
MANSYLSKTAASGNRRTWTFSAWVKRSGLTADNSAGYDTFFSSDEQATNSVRITFSSDSSNNKLRVYYYTGSMQLDLVTNREFRDTSAWYHIVVQVDTTQGTASDRAKIYVNGIQETSFATATYPSQNTDTSVNQSGAPHEVGRGGGNLYFNGYLSHVALVDGTVVAPTEFGETDSTSGIWKFKSPSGLSWGTNGVHLKFENSGNLGLDSSGQTNNYTVNGNLKQALDTPSNNHATTNPNSTGNFKQSTNPNLASNGNTTLLENGGQHKQAPTTLAADTGKWYCEVKMTSGSDGVFGVCSTSLSANLGDNYSYAGMNRTGSGIGLNIANGNKIVAGSESTHGAQISSGEIFMMALDLTNQKFYFGKNGAWATGSGAYSGNFDAAVGAISLPSGAGTSFDAFYQFSFSPYNSGCDINFGNGFFGTTAISSAGSNGNGSLFEYDVPTGFYALNTKNINTYG